MAGAVLPRGARDGETTCQETQPTREGEEEEGRRPEGEEGETSPPLVSLPCSHRILCPGRARPVLRLAHEFFSARVVAKTEKVLF